jgi:hypothetical protein
MEGLYHPDAWRYRQMPDDSYKPLHEFVRSRPDLVAAAHEMAKAKGFTPCSFCDEVDAFAIDVMQEKVPYEEFRAYLINWRREHGA